MTWEDVRLFSGYFYDITERTTVTNLIRRVGSFDYKQVANAVRVNMPTAIALTFADYLDCNIRGERTVLTDFPNMFVETLERYCNVPISYVGTGPKIDDIIIR